MKGVLELECLQQWMRGPLIKMTLLNPFSNANKLWPGCFWTWHLCGHLSHPRQQRWRTIQKKLSGSITWVKYILEPWLQGNVLQYRLQIWPVEYVNTQEMYFLLEKQTMKRLSRNHTTFKPCVKESQSLVKENHLCEVCKQTAEIKSSFNLHQVEIIIWGTKINCQYLSVFVPAKICIFVHITIWMFRLR